LCARPKFSKSNYSFELSYIISSKVKSDSFSQEMIETIKIKMLNDLNNVFKVFII